MAVPGQCWLEVVLARSDTGSAQVELLWVELLRLPVPVALQVELCLARRTVAERVVAVGEQQDNQTGTRWKDSRMAGKGHCL